MIANMLQAPYADVQLRFAGLNHMVWVHQATQQGRDVTAKVIDMLCDGAALTMNNIKEEPWQPDFLRALGAIPAPTTAIFTRPARCWRKRWPPPASAAPAPSR